MPPSPSSSPSPLPAISDPLYSRRQLENASCDDVLEFLLENCLWLHRKEFDLTQCMHDDDDLFGDPTLVLDVRREELQAGVTAETPAERRYVRNYYVLRQVATQICSPYPWLFLRFPAHTADSSRETSPSPSPIASLSSASLYSSSPLSSPSQHAPPRHQQSLRGDTAGAKLRAKDHDHHHTSSLSSTTTTKDAIIRMAHVTVAEEQAMFRQLAATIRRVASVWSPAEPPLTSLTIAVNTPSNLLKEAVARQYGKKWQEMTVGDVRSFEDKTLTSAAHRLDVKHATERHPTARCPAFFNALLYLLDRAIITADSGYHRDIFTLIFGELERHIPTTTRYADDLEFPSHLPYNPHILINPSNAVDEILPPHDIDFLAAVFAESSPYLIKGAMENWPARTNWHKPNYWLDISLNGSRFVPVELGRQYTDANWTQELLTIKDFLANHLLPTASTHPNKPKGYLAQYNLFTHFPVLQTDISPLPAFMPTLPEGQSFATNIWLGPAGTITPLHTDATSNLFVQVFGYKFVRLYSPVHSPCLYPRLKRSLADLDEHNTSQIDISGIVPMRMMEGVTREEMERRMDELEEDWQGFKGNQWEDVVMGPGDSLFIPKGWWHYVESLTVSGSVSFWW